MHELGPSVHPQTAGPQCLPPQIEQRNDMYSKTLLWYSVTLSFSTSTRASGLSSLVFWRAEYQIEKGMNWQKRQRRSEGFVAASPRKFTEQSNVLRSETGLTVLCGTAHYRSLSLELACLLDSLWGRPRMTESSHTENQSHPVISKDMLRLHLSYSEKFIFFSTSLFLHTFLSSFLPSATCTGEELFRWWSGIYRWISGILWGAHHLLMRVERECHYAYMINLMVKKWMMSLVTWSAAWDEYGGQQGQMHSKGANMVQTPKRCKHRRNKSVAHH